jgi:Family of unknown function (DUF5752)
VIAATKSSASFAIKDCALITLATGYRALTLQELRDRLADIPADTAFCHFWGALLQPRFEEREFGNDFAAWARHELHDPVLAERLAVIDAAALPGAEELRGAVLELVEERIDEEPSLARRPASREFHFARAQVVVFETGRSLERAAELARAVPDLSVGSVFFHFIEARRRHPQGLDDFSAWLAGRDADHTPLIERLRAIDPYFGSLVELRREIGAAMRHSFGEAGG